VRSGLRDRNLALFRQALFQQTVNFDFVSSANIHATIRDQRDDEAGGQRGAIPRAVLFGRINRLPELGGVECIRIDVALYPISYDIKSYDKDEYPKLWQTLGEMGATKILFSEWIIVAEVGQASSIYDRIAPCTVVSDRLLVQELTNDESPLLSLAHHLEDTKASGVLLFRLAPLARSMPAEGLPFAASRSISSRCSGLTPSFPAVCVSSCPVTGRFSAF